MTNPNIELSRDASELERHACQIKHLAFAVRDHHLREVDAFCEHLASPLAGPMRKMIEAAEELVTLIAELAADSEGDAAKLSDAIEETLPSSLPSAKSATGAGDDEGPVLRAVSGI